MDLLLSKHQCGFGRGFTAQKSSLEKAKAFGVPLTDLSKAFDCLSHELIKVNQN